MKLGNSFSKIKNALAASLLLAGASASSGATTNLFAGHTDIGLAYEDGAWDLHVHHEDTDTEYEPGDAILKVPPPAQTTVPGNPAFNFLGSAGSPVWILPQIEDEDLLFLGIAAEEVEDGVFVDDTMKLSLVSVSGPGKFALYTVDGFGAPTVWMNSRDGISASDFVDVPAGGHTEYNWAFSAAGTYTIRFQATATLNDGSNTVVNSGPIAYKFSVAAKTVISKGHVDVGLAFEDGEWEPHIHNETTDKEYGPREAILQINPQAQTRIPTNASFSFLGMANDAVWILPQVEDPQLIFLGLAAEEIEEGVFVGDTVKMSLVNVTGPGHFALYTVNGFGVPQVLMNSRDGIDAGDFADVPAGGHTDYNWAFSAPGIYKVFFQATGTLDDGANTFVDSGPVEYTFSVAAPDTNKPGISITSPLANSTNNPLVTALIGKATDGVRVGEVKLSLNGSAYESVALASNAATVNWSANLTLSSGTNTVLVKSIDQAGNESTPLKRVFFFHVNEALTLATNGIGSIIAKTNLTLGTPTGGASLLVGRPYQVKAVPGPHQVFSNWSGSVSGTNPVLDFVMETNLVIEANFIPNPFISAAGAYNGLFFETNETTGITHHSGGFFSASLKTNFSFSGKLLLDGDSVGISGKFALDGTFNKTFSRIKFGKGDLTLNLKINFDGGSDQITGTVTTTNWSANLTADRAVFSANHPVTNYSGVYTLLIPGFTNAVDGPIGYGYGLVNISTNGNIVITGATADGQSISQNVPISRNGEWPFYQPLYKGTDIVGPKTNVNYKGSLLSWLTITNLLTVSNAPHGTLSWIKTGWTNVYHPGGFTNTVDVLASFHKAPPVGTPALSGTNGTITLTNGNLLAEMARSFHLKTNNTIAVTPTNQLVKLTLTPRTGLLTGSFLHPDDMNKIKTIKGAILQEQNFGGGFFLGTNEAGLFRLQLEP